MNNSTFRGELHLNCNDLSDLAALHLAPVFEKQNGHNVSKLILDGNCFTSKAGEYIGGALVANPNYTIKLLSFTGICLESIGVTRIVEACNANTNIKRLDIGVLTDRGLADLAELLRPNQSLEEITIQETKDHQKLWTELGRSAFVNMLKECTKIMRVNLNFTRQECEEDKTFSQEIEFYTGIKGK